MFNIIVPDASSYISCSRSLSLSLCLGFNSFQTGLESSLSDAFCNVLLWRPALILSSYVQSTWHTGWRTFSFAFVTVCCITLYPIYVFAFLFPCSFHRLRFCLCGVFHFQLLSTESPNANFHFPSFPPIVYQRIYPLIGRTMVCCFREGERDGRWV